MTAVNAVRLHHLAQRVHLLLLQRQLALMFAAFAVVMEQIVSDVMEFLSLVWRSTIAACAMAIMIIWTVMALALVAPQLMIVVFVLGALLERFSTKPKTVLVNALAQRLSTIALTALKERQASLSIMERIVLRFAMVTFSSTHAVSVKTPVRWLHRVTVLINATDQLSLTTATLASRLLPAQHTTN
jgi:hypothetical protein